MHDHNLDDLIIDNIEPKNSKTKSFLTIIALLIVVLIVAIILTKILLKTPDTNGITVEDDTTEMIAPELKLKETPKKVEKPKEELSLSNIIEQKIKQPVVETKKTEIIEKPKTIKKPIPVKKEEKTEEVLKETVTITKEYTQIPQQDKKPVKITEEKKPEKIKKPIVIETPKPVVAPKKEIIVPKKIKTPVITPTPPKPVSTTTYYIQVGSFSKDPSARFLSVIKNSGFNYKITKASTKGIKKLLIGPYKSRTSANTALIQVRDRINKSAFVVKK